MKRLAIGLALAALAPVSAFAVESGTGAYLLGTRGLAAGFVPPPGVYLSDSIVYLQSRTRNDISIGGAIVADPSIEALLNLATVTVVPDMPAFGGTAALSVLVPYAGVDMDFSGRFLGGPQSATLHDSQDGFGDIVVTPTIGWHDGYWNYSGSLSFFLPTGEYSTAVVKPRQGVFDVLSISKNKFAVDPTVAVTWLNPNIGLEINAAAGITFSAINSATDYQTAPELHVEAAIGQHFASGLVIGAAGYGYHQLANDSGSGAEAFQAAVGAKSLQATVFGAGPVLGYQTKIGDVGLNLQGKYFHEFGVKRRLASDVYWLTAALAF
jgi:hypothetical protein